MDLHEILKKQKYRKINFRVTKTQHLLIRASINGIKGNFILDTGASNSCVGNEGVAMFALQADTSKTLAAGAGATGMATQIAHGNTLKIGRWTDSDFSLVVFDMSHVNTALRDHKARAVEGIIGADVLLKGKAIIDYFNHCVYLR